MGSQGVLSEVRAWDDAMSVGKEDRGSRGGGGEEICVIHWKWGQQGRVLCFRSGDETRRLDLEEQRESCRSTCSLPTSLARVACRFLELWAGLNQVG